MRKDGVGRMRQSRGRVGRRGRALLAALGCVVAIAGTAVAARKALAHWAIARALEGAGVGPAAFRVDRVGFGGIGVAGLSLGAPAWLTAERVDVALTIAGLLEGRAGAVTVSGARWTVDARADRVARGRQPAPGATSEAFDLPCDAIELRAATVLFLTRDEEHEVSVDGVVTRSGAGAGAVRLEVEWLGQTATLAGAFAVSGPRTTIDAEVTAASFARQLGGLPLTVAGGAVTTRVTLGADGATGSTLAVRAAEIRAGAVVVRGLELTATLDSERTAELRLRASGDGWELPAALGSVGWEERAEEPGVYAVRADARTGRPMMFAAPSAGVAGSVEDVRIAARALVGRSGVRVLDGRASAEGASLTAGDASLTEGRAVATLTDGTAVRIEGVRAVLSDGAVVGAEPFDWTIGDRRIAATLTATNLSLERWLPVLTNNRATGEGRVSGGVEVALDWSDGPVRLGRLDGSLRADPAHGFIQASDADALGDLLERQDPRFATDEVMRPVRDKIVAAMRDFEFHALTADLSRDGDRTSALTYLSGFGRHGEDPQGINLTLDLHVQDSFVGLASRLAAKARIREATGAALEDFFGGSGGAKEDR